MVAPIIGKELVETGVEVLVKPLIGELQAKIRLQEQLKVLAAQQRLDIETARINREMSFQFDRKTLEIQFQNDLALKEKEFKNQLELWAAQQNFDLCWPLNNTPDNDSLKTKPNLKNVRPVMIFITKLKETDKHSPLMEQVNMMLKRYFAHPLFRATTENALTSQIGAWKPGFNENNHINNLFEWLKLRPCVVVNPQFIGNEIDLYINSWGPFYEGNAPIDELYDTLNIPDNENETIEKITCAIALLTGFYTDIYHLLETGAQPQMPFALKDFCEKNNFKYEVPQNIIDSYRMALLGITCGNCLGEKLPFTYLNMAKSLHAIGADYAIKTSKQLLIEGVGIWANRKSDASKEIRLPETLDDCIGLLRNNAETTDEEYLDNVRNTLLVLGMSNVAKEVDKKIEQLPFENQYEMVFVQGGTFTMGATPEQGNDCFDNEKPVHHVTVSDYYIGKYLVTQAKWKLIMGSYPSELYNTGCEDCPVERVSWNDVQEFIRKLNAKTGENFRLPTEAEWEFAARGGNQSKGNKYSGSNNINEVAWYSENYKNSNHGTKGTTHPVGTKKPNELGIHDMSGNVWEWCNDWSGGYTGSSQNNPVGPATGSSRVLRGGSWDSRARYCRVSYRSYYIPDYFNYYCGFRLARSL